MSLKSHGVVTVRLPFLERAVPQGLSRILLPALIVGVGYYAGCLIGFALRFPGSGISFLWPPTAVLTSGLLITPRRTWLPMLAGAFAAHAVAHTQDGVPLGTWPVQFVANATQALVAAYVVTKYSTGPRLFSDLRSAAVFILGAAIAAPALASLIPVVVYVNLGWASDAWQAWRTRVVSNSIASLTLVPLIVAAWKYLWPRPALPPVGRLGEFTLLLISLMATSGAALQIERSDARGLSLALYAPVPFLLWAAVRFGAVGCSCALLSSALLMIADALQGHGPLVAATPADTVIALQLFIGVTAIPLMLMAGMLEEKRTEHRTLVEIEQQNSAILRALPDMMFVLTKDGFYLDYFAKNSAGLLATPPAFLGRHVRDVLPPDLAERVLEAFGRATTEEPALVEYSLSIGDERRQYEARCIAVDRDRILSIVRDTTERTRGENALRESQQRYTLATAGGGVGVWDVNLTTGERYVGPELTVALGYGDTDIPSLASYWERFVHPADLDDLKTRWTALSGGNTSHVETEHRVLHKDGSTRWFLTKGEITERIDGKAVRMTGTWTDVTQRRRTERALKHANAALSRMARITSLGELTASIAHEVNQPLCAIVANANACLRWLDTAAPDADFRGALEDVVQDSHRASAIIRRTRELVANRPVRKTTLNLNDPIRDVLQLARARLERSGITLTVDLDDKLPPVSADELQIQQVVLNLVLNSVEAMRGVNDRPHVLGVRSRRGKELAVVSVRDTGEGVARRQIERIFDPFYTTKPRGLGIGLSISRSIIKSHGGSLWAVANANCGVTFRFTLPLITDEHV